MSDISVSLDELLAVLEQVKQDGYDIVEVGMLEEDEFDGEYIPATLHISGVERDYLGLCDYEPIDAIDIAEYRGLK